MYSGIQGSFANPQAIVTHFHLREGDTVADLGAGSGQYMKPLSDAVGKSGRVYLCDIQKSLVEAMGNHARERGITNVRPLWGDLEHTGGIRIDDHTLDTAILSNVLFQIEDKKTAIAEIGRILRPGGKLYIVDWSESFGGMGPRPEDVITEDEVRSLCEAGGFTYVSSFPAGDHHYGLAFKKA